METLNTTGTWVVSYNPVQNNFHIDTLAQELKINMKQYLTRSRNAYMPLGIFENMDDAVLFVKDLEKQHRMKPERVIRTPRTARTGVRAVR